MNQGPSRNTPSGRTRCLLGVVMSLALSNLGNAADHPSNPEFPLPASDPKEVVVVYNSRLDDSREVAEYYAEKRGIPEANLIGIRINDNETVTRRRFRRDLERPLWDRLVKEGFFQYKEFEPNPDTQSGNGSGKTERIVAARIRYLVLCYGIPLRIEHEPSLKEEDTPYTLQHGKLDYNGSAVDSELALLPLLPAGYIRKGPVDNPVFGSTRPEQINALKGVLLVSRLDGPDKQTAMGLVDKAIEAEQDGLWGRAYFDLRNLQEGDYKLGDDWIRQASAAAKRAGWETIIDLAPDTIPSGFPLSHVGLYAGWYSTHVCGPFAEESVEFTPGAFAYHLHSNSANSLKTPNQNWVGPLLSKGVTATMGCVAEPYLALTPHVGVFFERFFAGFSLGEAAYACQAHLSWQTTVVGDPLYRPFNQLPQTMHEHLSATGNPAIEWSYLRVINLNLNLRTPISQLIHYLNNLTVTPDSAILQEKLGNLYYLQNDLPNTLDAYERALRISHSAEQKKRLMVNLSRHYKESGRTEDTLRTLEKLLETYPNHPERTRFELDRQSLRTGNPPTSVQGGQ